MKTVERVLTFLCQTPLEQRVATAICEADKVQSREFWLQIHGLFAESASCLRFDSFDAVARCHQLCVAAAPDYGSTWVEIVLDDLMPKPFYTPHLDTYVVGSLIGLFEAGNWLQRRDRKLLGGSFLSRMGAYSLIQLQHELRISTSNEYGVALAQKMLDRAVKNYLRPETKAVEELLKPEVSGMLTEIRDSEKAKIGWCNPQPGPGSWLFTSLIYGVLDIERRDHHELVRAALAMTSA